MKRFLYLIALMTAAVSLGKSANSAVGEIYADKKIRILLVGDLVLLEQPWVNDQVTFLTQSWSNSNLNTNISLEIVNPNGIPIEYENSSWPYLDSGFSRFEQRNLVEDFVESDFDINDPNSPSIREAYAADVIIAFTSGIPGRCGFATGHRQDLN